MKNKRFAILMSLMLALSLLFAACGGGADSGAATTPEAEPTAEQPADTGDDEPAGEEPAAEEPAETDEAPAGGDVAGKEVTMILKNLTNPFFISVKEGAEAAADELGIDLTVLAPQVADSNEEQSQMAEQAIVNQADLLIMCPADSTGIVPAMQKVNEAGIPIVNLNTKIDMEEVIWETFVAIENYDAGYQTVSRLADMMDGEGEIFIIEGTTGAQTSIDRTAGALDALAEHPGIEIVAQQSGEYNRATAMDVVQNLLQAYPNVKAIYCCNDEMALGAVEAIDAAGKIGDILVAGCDANADARAAIQDGKMHLSCDSQPFVQGYEAVMAAAEALRGNTLPDFVKTDMLVVGIEELA